MWTLWRQTTSGALVTLCTSLRLAIIFIAPLRQTRRCAAPAQHSVILALQHWRTFALCHCGTQSFSRGSAPLQQSSGAAELRCSRAKVHQCSSAAARQFASAAGLQQLALVCGNERPPLLSRRTFSRASQAPPLPGRLFAPRQPVRRLTLGPPNQLFSSPSRASIRLPRPLLSKLSPPSRAARERRARRPPDTPPARRRPC